MLKLKTKCIKKLEPMKSLQFKSRFKFKKLKISGKIFSNLLGLFNVNTIQYVNSYIYVHLNAIYNTEAQLGASLL